MPRDRKSRSAAQVRGAENLAPVTSGETFEIVLKPPARVQGQRSAALFVQTSSGWHPTDADVVQSDFGTLFVSSSLDAAPGTYELAVVVSPEPGLDTDAARARIQSEKTKGDVQIHRLAVDLQSP